MRKKLWKPEDIEFVFSSYNDFEERLLNFLKVIPYNEINKNVWSPELVSLFLDICGLIDSMSRYILGQGKVGIKRKAKVLDEKGKQIERKITSLNIIDFELNIFNQLELEKYQVILYIYSVYPNCIITPYKDYREKEEWWTVYNKLKHNRLDNYKDANFYNILKSLSALFLLIVAYDESEDLTLALLRHGWINTNWVPEVVHRERIQNPRTHWCDTNLFGSGYCLKGALLEKLEDMPVLVESRKFTNFVGKANR
ncbi:hypothetical protein KAI92_01970 [Candidatus Parcubacteria bacterium]|nr:hypothetical protein [Candidatus Parcubacteria bacterium]